MPTRSGRRPTVDPAPVGAPIVLEWEKFKPVFARNWRQGEHVAIVAPTGGGKSVLLFELAKIAASRQGKDRRPARVVVLGVKHRDDELTRLHNQGWPIIKRWPPNYGDEHCIVWPRGDSLSKASARQRAVFVPLLDTIHKEGGQTVVIDEEAHFEESPPEGLGMRGMMTPFWTGARSNHLSIMAATQRPRNVSRSMWSEPSWVFVLKPEDDDDTYRIAELTGNKRRDRREAFLEIVDRLGDYEFLCVRRQRGGGRGLYVSRVER